MAQTQKQKKMHVCESKWARRIVGVKRAAKRRMDEVRVGVGVDHSFEEKLTRSRLVWACRVERMRDKKQILRKWREKESTKAENVMGGLH